MGDEQDAVAKVRFLGRPEHRVPGRRDRLTPTTIRPASGALSFMASDWSSDPVPTRAIGPARAGT